MKNIFNRPLVYAHGTEEILKDLNQHIIDKKPFSTIRYGDGCLGIVCSFLSPNFIKEGKWMGGEKNGIANSVMRQQGIPKRERSDICKKVVWAANEANYIDCYDSFFVDISRSKGLGFLASNWKIIHENVGITNTSYCNPYLHYMSVVENEYNLFDVIKNRRVFCISNQIQVCNNLKKNSGAKVIDFYQIPRSGAKTQYPIHHPEIVSIITKKSNIYDIFLIGAGLLGKIYCGMVKDAGGRAFDSGRLFDLWSGIRKIDSVPKRFIKMCTKTMLAKRIKKTNSRVW